jgi:hypothetical protein
MSLFDLIWVIAGYLLAICTWRYLRQFLTGLESEITALRRRLRALEAKKRSK